MFQLNTDDGEEEDFPVIIEHPNSSQRLSSLFVDDSSDMTSDLKYVAPKQPQKQSSIVQHDGMGTASSHITVLFASAVSLFCHEKETVKNIGKVMCCITKDTKDIFVLLIYKTKQQVIAQAIIHSSFSIMIQPNNFAIFFDDKNLQWSIHLSTNFDHFLTQIGICRAFLSFKVQCELALFAQDISLGEGELIEEGDLVKFSFNSWLVENFKRGIQLENQKDCAKFTVIKSSTSWQMGLVGGQTFLRRIIFVPNTQVYATDESSMIAYEVQIEKIYKKELNSKELPAARKLDDHIINKDLLAKAEITSSYPIPPSKASLISRMAKVGQALLPSAHHSTHSYVPTDSESEIEEIKDRSSPKSRNSSASSSIEESNTNPSPVTRQCEKLNKKMSLESKHQDSITFVSSSEHLSHSKQDHSVPGSIQYSAGITKGSMSASNEYNYLPPGALVSYHPSPFSQAYQTQQTSSLEPVLSLLLAESRSQNTDLRIALSQLTEKVNQVGSKINSQEFNQYHSYNPVAIAPLTHPKCNPRELLIQITSLVQENEEVKQEIEKLGKINDELNFNYTEIMKKNQRLLEDKTELLMQKREKSSPEKTKISLQEVLSIQEEKVKIGAQLEHALKVVKSLENEVEMTKKSYLNVLEERDTYITKLDEEKSTKFAFEERLEQQNEEISTLKVSIAHIQDSSTKLSSASIGQTALVNNLERDKRVLESKLKEKEVYCQKLYDELKGYKKSIQMKEDHVNLLLKENTEYKEKYTDLEKQVKDMTLKQVPNLDNSFQKEEELSALVKQIMNMVYKKFKGLFISTESYEGKLVLENVLTVIRDTTLQYIEKCDEQLTVQPTKINEPEGLSEESTSIERQEWPTAENLCRIPDLTKKTVENDCLDQINSDTSPEISLANLATKVSDNAESVQYEKSASVSKHNTNNEGRNISNKCVLLDNVSPIIENNTDNPSSNNKLNIGVIEQNSSHSPVSIMASPDVVSANYVSSSDNNQEVFREIQVSKNTLYCEEVESKVNHGSEEKFSKPVIDLPSETNEDSKPVPILEKTEQFYEEDWRPIPPPVPSLFSDSDEDDDNWLP